MKTSNSSFTRNAAQAVLPQTSRKLSPSEIPGTTRPLFLGSGESLARSLPASVFVIHSKTH